MQSNDQCAICIEPLDINTIDTVPIVTLGCAHQYHQQCIVTWITQHHMTIGMSGRWACALSSVRGSDDVLVGVCDTGDFCCPVCKRRYTTLHYRDAPCEAHQMLMLREYQIKIKFAIDGIDISDLWLSQYLADFDDLVRNYHVSDDNKNHIIGTDSDMVDRFFSQIYYLLQQRAKTNDVLVLHAMRCECADPECAGYFFVPEHMCGVCMDMRDTMILPDHISHASAYQIKKQMAWWREIKASGAIKTPPNKSSGSDESDGSDVDCDAMVCVASHGRHGHQRDGKGHGHGHGHGGRGRGGRGGHHGNRGGKGQGKGGKGRGKGANRVYHAKPRPL
jgi:hypothetical protein